MLWMMTVCRADIQTGRKMPFIIYKASAETVGTSDFQGRV